MSKAPRLICFDWGGVILRICADWSEAVAASGLDDRPIPGSDEARLRRKEILREYETGRIECDMFFDSLSEAIDGVYSPTEICKIQDAWLIEEYPGASELLDELHDRGIETAMLSNTNPRHWSRRLSDEHGSVFPTAGRIRQPHASHLLGLAKPESGIYRAFERAVGVAAPEILFFDDRASNVDAAIECGLQSERIDPAGDPPAQIRRILAEIGLIGQ